MRYRVFFMIQNNLLDHSQAGFCHWYNPETTLLCTVNVMRFLLCFSPPLLALKNMPSIFCGMAQSLEAPDSSSFLVFLLYNLTLFIAVQLQDVFSLGSLFSPLNFACESTWPPSSRKKMKVAQKHHQEHCFSVNSIQICAICITMYLKIYVGFLFVCFNVQHTGSCGFLFFWHEEDNVLVYHQCLKVHQSYFLFTFKKHMKSRVKLSNFLMSFSLLEALLNTPQLLFFPFID